MGITTIDVLRMAYMVFVAGPAFAVARYFLRLHSQEANPQVRFWLKAVILWLSVVALVVIFTSHFVFQNIFGIS